MSLNHLYGTARRTNIHKDSISNNQSFFVSGDKQIHLGMKGQIMAAVCIHTSYICVCMRMFHMDENVFPIWVFPLIILIEEIYCVSIKASITRQDKCTEISVSFCVWHFRLWINPWNSHASWEWIITGKWNHVGAGKVAWRLSCVSFFVE